MEKKSDHYVKLPEGIVYIYVYVCVYIRDHYGHIYIYVYNIVYI